MTTFRKLVASLIVLLAESITVGATPISNIYVLGDSLSDQGNLKTATGSLLPDPLHYANGRFSNGPVYTDYLSSALGRPLMPSISGGNNFAYGGARTNYNTVEQRAGGPFPNDLFPWSLNLEVQDFRNRNINDPNGLFIVLSGSNDIGDIVRNGLNPATAVPVVVQGIINAVQAVRDAGGQRIVVGNVADLGLTPAFRQAGPGAQAAATAVSALVNSQLHQALGNVTGLQIIEFDLFKFVQSLVNDPSILGLTNVTSPCYSGFVAPNPAATECGNPAEFLFWDLVHPTTQVHALIAQEIFAAIPEPSVLTLMLLALLALTLVRRRDPARQ